MTDKELKKLSRLEILEILLEESKENERLRAELEEIKNENSIAQNVQTLSELTKKLDSALIHAEALTKDLQTITKEGITVKTEAKALPVKEKTNGQSYPTPPVKESAPVDEKMKNIIISDRKLYWRMMHFYSQNEMALAFLPPDIQNDVRIRLRGILDARK